MSWTVVYKPYELGITIIITLFYKWENQDQGMLNNLSKVTCIRGNNIYW